MGPTPVRSLAGRTRSLFTNGPSFDGVSLRSMATQGTPSSQCSTCRQRGEPAVRLMFSSQTSAPAPRWKGRPGMLCQEENAHWIQNPAFPTLTATSSQKLRPPWPAPTWLFPFLTPSATSATKPRTDKSSPRRDSHQTQPLLRWKKHLGSYRGE